MPNDTRRLPVPDDSQAPYVFEKLEKCVDLLNGQNNRSDGRTTDQVRPVYLKAGTISQARGSAYIEMGHTKVICAVYGPREVTRRDEFSMKGQLTCEFKFASFSCKNRRQHQQDNQEKEYCSILEEALEPAVCLDKFPKARMDVFVTVLQDDGSSLAAAISCASIALADAGVEMYDLVVGCSMRQYGQDTLLDPCSDEQYKVETVETSLNQGGMTIGLMPSLNQISAIAQKGELEMTVVTQGMKQCIDTCQRLYPVLQQCLVKSLKGRIASPDR